jgi:hypothetical protein
MMKAPSNKRLHQTMARWPHRRDVAGEARRSAAKASGALDAQSASIEGD